MEFICKKFAELTVYELHEILRARCRVFVVEQACPYQDVDGVDPDAMHLFFRDGNGLAAYLRMFPRPGEPGTVQIGRVMTIRRGVGLGGELMREAIRAAEEYFPGCGLFLEAQVQAVGFYEKSGFRVTSGEFDEDGIPHVEMRLKNM